VAAEYTWAWSHLWHFTGRVWTQVLIWHSATSFSTIRDICLPLVLLIALVGFRIREWRRPGVRDLVISALRTVVVLLALLGLVFIAAIPVVMWQYHYDLARKNQDLARANGDLTRANSETARERDDWKKKAQQPNPPIARPPSEPLRVLVRYYGLEHQARVNDKIGRVILVEGLTNRDISPVDVNLVCDHDFLPMNQPHVGIDGLYQMEELRPIDARSINVRLGSPAWTATAPLGVPIFTEANSISCQLQVNGTH